MIPYSAKLSRENIYDFRGFGATRESFLHKNWVCRTYLYDRLLILALCENLLREMVTSYWSVKVFPSEVSRYMIIAMWMDHNSSLT